MTETEFLLHLVRAATKETDKGEFKEEKREKIDIKITFRGGGEIVVPDEQWDDYRYDGEFFTIVHDGVDIAMYNAREVFSLVLVKQGGE